MSDEKNASAQSDTTRRLLISIIDFFSQLNPTSLLWFEETSRCSFQLAFPEQEGEKPDVEQKPQDDPQDY